MVIVTACPVGRAVSVIGKTEGFFVTFFSRFWLTEESNGGTAAVLYQLISRLFTGTFFSNHTFTCSKLYSPVMTAVWSFMATNLTLS